MSSVLKMIENFPRGCSTGKLMRMHDIDYSPQHRRKLMSEIEELAREGLIELGKNRKWRAKSRRHPPPPINPNPVESPSSEFSEPLRAVPAQFRQVSYVENTPESENEIDTTLNPQALLRYYRSALRVDPRGALTQSPDRHSTAFQLVTGSGKWWGGEEILGEMSLQLDHLPNEFREALIKREANENTLAVGWPVSVGRKFGAPCIQPVGLFVAEWKREKDTLFVTIETDNVLVNPDWIKSASRSTSWSMTGLSQIFSTTSVAGLFRDEFLDRLKEAMAKTVRGRLQGIRLSSLLDPNVEGIHDAMALFLPTDSTFTAGAVRDLDRIATWSLDRLSQTALAPFLELESATINTIAPAINVGPLNAEQINSVDSAMRNALTVITGPPGTGKSQTIVATVVSALAANQRVLVASKNHQALDALEDRLLDIAPSTEFMVRTLNPAKEVDIGIRHVIETLVQTPSRTAAVLDKTAIEILMSLSEERKIALEIIEEKRRLNCQLADHIERRDSIKTYQSTTVTSDLSSHRKVSWFRRFIRDFRRIKISKSVVLQESIPTGAKLHELNAAIARDRSRLETISESADPVELTHLIAEKARKYLPRFLSKVASVDEEERLNLNNDLRDLQLTGETNLDHELISRVLDHRPLWLVSVLGVPKRIDLHDCLFDLVIFDEASQCDIASSLPLLARSRRSVIVGDDSQLAFIPQVGAAQDRNLMAAQGLPIRKGMGRFAQGRVSLFQFAESVPNVSTIMLRDQYRSAGAIVEYINEQFYKGKLRSTVDPEKLKMPKGCHSSLAWSHVSGKHTLTSNGNTNRGEVEAICYHLKNLLLDQGYAGSVGVVTPFRAQVRCIQTALNEILPVDVLEKNDLRVATVDSFQGQERDVIIFSPVVCAESTLSGVVFLQREWRRINVAISRARAVAHIFGDLDYARSGKIVTLQRLAAKATTPRKRSGEGEFDSEWERRMDVALRLRGLDPKPQYEIAGRRLDFALFGADGIKLDLEVDGRMFHQDIDGNRKLDDVWRDHQMRSLGWKVRRFWVDELNQDMEGCLDIIEQELKF